MSENINPTPEFIEQNYKKVLELIESIMPAGRNKDQMLNLFNGLGLRYATCPASSKEEYYSAFNGGLCYHNLHTLKWLSRFAKLMAPNEYTPETLLTVTLLSELGKVGDMNLDYYLTGESWQVKNGTYYKINDSIDYMRIPQRSLFLANQFGIELTQDEYLTILLSEGQYDEANSSYKYREPELSLIFNYANHWSQRLEKHNKIVR